MNKRSCKKKYSEKAKEEMHVLFQGARYLITLPKKHGTYWHLNSTGPPIFHITCSIQLALKNPRIVLL